MKGLSRTVRWTPFICFPLLALVTSCNQASIARTNGLAQDSNGTAAYRLQAFGPHQLLLRPTADSTHAIIILDWVDGQAPVVNLGQVIDHYELQHDGRDLVLFNSGLPLARFSTADDPASTAGEKLYHVNGISKLTDSNGFATGALGASSLDDAFDAAKKARKTGDDTLRSRQPSGPTGR